MRYSQLKAFHYVAAEGGFSRAARVLNQSQPSLSDQVRQLERLHDTLLFYREKRQIRLTDAGKDLFLLTRKFFDVEEQIGDCLSQYRKQLEGTLRVVADAALHVTTPLAAFRTANPKVFVSISTGNSEDVLRRLRNYDAEIGVVGNISSTQDLDEIPLGQAPVVAIVAPGFLPNDVQALDLETLSHSPLIFRETGSSTQRCLEASAKKHAIKLRPVITVEGRQALCEVVASGAGIGFVSLAELGNLSDICAVPIEGVALEMKEKVVFLSTRRDLPMIRAFVRGLREDNLQLV